jgi:hypothetical protein
MIRALPTGLTEERSSDTRTIQQTNPRCGNTPSSEGMVYCASCTGLQPHRWPAAPALRPDRPPAAGPVCTGDSTFTDFHVFFVSSWHYPMVHRIIGLHEIELPPAMTAAPGLGCKTPLPSGERPGEGLKPRTTPPSPNPSLIGRGTLETELRVDAGLVTYSPQPFQSSLWRAPELPCKPGGGLANMRNLSRTVILRYLP